MVGRPIEFATDGPFGASPSATLFRAPTRAYSQLAYLDHGYAFFAPDPGPSHLIRATITPADGEPIRRYYPDLQDQRPRLLYHRHFMLAEFLNDVYHPPGDPPQEVAEDAEAALRWRLARNRYEAVRDSILNRLRTRYPDSEVTISRVEHRQPGLPEYLEDQMPLDDPQLYRVLPDRAETGGADPPLAPPVVAPLAPLGLPR